MKFIISSLFIVFFLYPLDTKIVMHPENGLPCRIVKGEIVIRFKAKEFKADNGGLRNFFTVYQFRLVHRKQPAAAKIENLTEQNFYNLLIDRVRKKRNIRFKNKSVLCVGCLHSLHKKNYPTFE